MPPVAFLGRMMISWMQWGTLFGNLIPAVLWEQITLAKSCNLPFKKIMFVGKMQGSLFSALFFPSFSFAIFARVISIACHFKPL